MTSRWRQLFALLLALGLIAAACGDSDSDDTSASDEPETTEAMEEEAACEPSDVQIGLVTDTGKVDDKSFNQSAWEGAQEAAAILCTTNIDFIETEAAADYENNIQLFLDDGADIIITVGFGLGEATSAAAAANPEVAFIGVDQFQGEAVDNVAGLIFPEDQSGFLAGALAGMLTESNIVGAVLGTDLVPPVVAFKEGWENGARYTNADVETISTYHPGGLDVAFTDPDWGATTARQALDQGADIVFGAGGSTGNGALIEVASEEGAFCVGVDTDQWLTVPEAQPCLVTSAMKLITPGVAGLVQQAAAGTMAGGNFVGDVGLSPYHDFDSTVTDEMRATLEEVLAGLNDGSIATGYPVE